ncbi:MAG: hypothetical protein HY700_20720 [Gemmatimonadetes bacterium]|nr:hypothetical protein [Gemmatimonadota bacterium]
MARRIAAIATALVALGPLSAPAQHPPGQQGSRNVKIAAHVPVGGWLRAADVEIEQELSRPYAYIAIDALASPGLPNGIDIISLKDLSRAHVLYSWRIDNPEIHRGLGSLNPMYLKSHGRYFLTSAFQYQQAGPDSDLGAIVWDVTGLPDTSTIKEVARIASVPGGFHETFSYKHSNGLALLFGTSLRGAAYVYDIDKVVANGRNGAAGLVGRVPVPEGTEGPAVVPSLTGYHDFYVGYDPASHQDRFYGAGAQGYYVYDVTDLSAPRLLTSITGVAGVPFGHTFMPEPTGRYVVGETEHQYQPLRIFDLKPGLDGQVKTISRPIGAWTADWKHLSHNFEVRWPYVFVAALEDGFYAFNMKDQTNPYTVGYYDTYDGPDGKNAAGVLGSVFNGAWGVDVRNADGLIVISDFTTGFWAFQMEGFDGWNGHQWGVPNVSSAQDWDNGPEGAPKPQRVSVQIDHER